LIKRLKQINKKPGLLIQDAMPSLSNDKRELIITGITNDIWDQYLGYNTEIEKNC
jgi:hypothetical protein